MNLAVQTSWLELTEKAGAIGVCIALVARLWAKSFQGWGMQTGREIRIIREDRAEELG